MTADGAMSLLCVVLTSVLWGLGVLFVLVTVASLLGRRLRVLSGDDRPRYSEAETRACFMKGK